MAAKRGRTPGFAMSDEHRLKIQNSNILNVLLEHVHGRREMSATQVTAGLALLRKVMPDLSSVEHSGTIDTGALDQLTDEQIVARLTELRGRGGSLGASASAPPPPRILN